MPWVGGCCRVEGDGIGFLHRLPRTKGAWIGGASSLGQTLALAGGQQLAAWAGDSARCARYGGRGRMGCRIVHIWTVAGAGWRSAVGRVGWGFCPLRPLRWTSPDGLSNCLNLDSRRRWLAVSGWPRGLGILPVAPATADEPGWVVALCLFRNALSRAGSWLMAIGRWAPAGLAHLR